MPDSADRMKTLYEALEECRAAIWEVGGSMEIVEWTGNTRYRKIYGRVVRALQEGEEVMSHTTTQTTGEDEPSAVAHRAPA